MRPININLDEIEEEKLLDLRLCQLPIGIQGTWLESCVTELHKELKDQGLLFQPKCYLADEWLTPDLEPVIGIPFYLAHPRLMKLEKKMMLEVEGETKEWCLKLLRHEAGHAINYAFEFYKRDDWKNTFGNFKEDYEDVYRFRPYSKNYVRHLENYYAQYHPDEDFSETFAVWLNPSSNWEYQYKGWPALKKLNYMDQLMTEVQGIKPVKTSGVKCWQASKIQKSLKKHYKKRQRQQAEDFPHFHDDNLKKIFAEKDESNAKLPKASAVLRRHKKHLLQSLSRWTGEKKHVSNDLVNKIIKRCQELHLVCKDPEPVAIMRLSVYISTLVMNYLYTGRLRGEHE